MTPSPGAANRLALGAGALAAVAAGALAGALAGVIPVAAPAPISPAPLRGTVLVLDGDTLELGHLRIRLYGIDAPELDQRCGTPDGGDWPCGTVARDRLASLVAGVEVGCEPRERDSYGRLIARCAANGHDLGARLVGEGLAWAYLAFSHHYAEAEAEARGAGIGIWQGEALAAWHHRSTLWTPAAGAAPPAVAGPPAARAAEPGDCAIKGNISARGDRVYHVPGSRWYARTIIEPASGERWFCTEVEAEAAGWRPAAGAGSAAAQAGSARSR